MLLYWRQESRQSISIFQVGSKDVSPMRFAAMPKRTRYGRHFRTAAERIVEENMLWYKFVIFGICFDKDPAHVMEDLTPPKKRRV